MLHGHAAFAGLVLASGAAMAAAFGGLPLAVLAALSAAVLPALAAQVLRLGDGDRQRAGLIGLWAVSAAAAIVLTGGAAGPFAAWAAAPLAVAVALDRRRLISAGAALSLTVLAAGLVASLAGAGAPEPEALRLWLSLLATGTTLGALAAAILGAWKRRSDGRETAESAAARLEALLAEQPHFVMTLDVTGRVASGFGATPPGIEAGALFEQGLIAQAHHPDRPALQTALHRALAQGEAEAGFAPRRALDRWAALTVRRLDDGRLAGVLRDATWQHSRELSLEAAKSEAESQAAGKARFLAEMSHELRTPLNAVIGFSDIMRRQMFGPMPQKYAEYAQAIHESGGHLLDLINDVLDMSKIEAERYQLALETFDAREPVSAALRLVRLQAHEAEVSLRGVLPPEPLTVEADRRALKQMTLNLLSNALKFTPKGGSVTVTLRQDGAALELSVADTGVGIAPEDVQRLGRPYEQAGDAGQRARGTGLGLSLVRAFAELHGGAMALESTLGEGTAVTVRLPVVKADRRPPGGAEIIPLEGRR
ncbi:MAG TPA: HAMP domain-containing sensor histidine kinase [Caulobacteraceae bacterium]|nr:HAMP domain-containing sensor histidine kinase [Caulobacteraceae bacterium]